MQNNDNTPLPGSDLEDTEIGGEVETKADSKKPHGVAAAQNPDKV
jgi:hypothetical protein